MPVERGHGGYLVIRKPWPGMFRTLYEDDERYVSNYFSRFDGARTSRVTGRARTPTATSGCWVASTT